MTICLGVHLIFWPILLFKGRKTLFGWESIVVFSEVWYAMRKTTSPTKLIVVLTQWTNERPSQLTLESLYTAQQINSKPNDTGNSGLQCFALMHSSWTYITCFH
jgi:hypothetical protein